MRTVVIKECESITIPNVFTYDLTQMDVKNCIGCWSCWWKKPGICAYKDLDEFYHQYITADKAIYFSKVTKGFVSGNLKNLFDRMIPLYLPYVAYNSGESMHAPRYEKYPEIEFYYDGEFETDASRQIFVDYINRVFYQFHSKNITVKPIEEFIGEVGDIA